MATSKKAQFRLHESQLALPFFAPAPAPSPAPPSSALASAQAAALAVAIAPMPALVSAELPAPPPAVSRTRALVDAVQRHLPHARVVITDNRTVLLSQAQKDGVRIVRAHQMFLDAPERVRAAVAHYLAHGDRSSGRIVDAFVDAQAHLLELAARPLKEGAHRGRTWDLMPMYDAINAAYFGNSVDAEIGWSQSGKPWRRRRTSITFGSYDGRARRIVIHPVLDLAEVPRLCVERVVHHEMLHAVHGDMRGDGGRRIVHSKAFRADEAKFEGAREADAWFDKHLDALLRWRPGQSLSGRRS